MIGHTRLLSALAKVVTRTRAAGVSVCAHARTQRVFRFAHEAIHQDLIQENVSVTVKVIQRHRIGVASIDTLEPQGLTRCVRAAMEIARHAPQQHGLPDLPARHRINTRSAYVTATTRVRPAERVDAVKRLFHICKGAGATLAGSLVTGDDEFAVVNSSGVRCYAASTSAGAKLVTMYGKLSGFACEAHRDVRQLHLEQLLKTSLSQCLHRQEPITLPLGSYEVILGPEAVAELTTWLGYIGFGAKSVAEHTSFLTGRIGRRLIDSQITIYDDGNEPDGLQMPFDFEGVPKQRTILIDRGKAAGAVYDSTYGARAGQPSTGHAMKPDDTDGPLPLHLAMAPGRASVSGMIRSCQRGLLIPRFNYVNGLLNPREALMTGLTHEGVFLIEDGAITAPVKRLRFTQSLLEAFNHVRAVSKERRLIADPSLGLGCAIMPTLHLAKFKFTGRSEE